MTSLHLRHLKQSTLISLTACPPGLYQFYSPITSAFRSDRQIAEP
jgi:hypothetical protein